MGNRVGYLGELEQMLMWTVLRLGDEAYGMAVRDELARRAGREVARGAVYITLDRLVKKGYLRSRLGETAPGRGGRGRRYFRVTEAGRHALKEARDALVSIWQGLDEALEEG
jgi:DNA-binding PadR family transcriptional regulator